MTFSDGQHNVQHSPLQQIISMTSFVPVTADEMEKSISSQDTACDLDPLPTKLLDALFIQ